jgi:hypothetical protein
MSRPGPARGQHGGTGTQAAAAAPGRSSKPARRPPAPAGAVDGWNDAASVGRGKFGEGNMPKVIERFVSNAASRAPAAGG